MLNYEGLARHEGCLPYDKVVHQLRQLDLGYLKPMQHTRGRAQIHMDANKRKIQVARTNADV